MIQQIYVDSLLKMISVTLFFYMITKFRLVELHMVRKESDTTFIMIKKQQYAWSYLTVSFIFMLVFYGTLMYVGVRYTHEFTSQVKEYMPKNNEDICLPD